MPPLLYILYYCQVRSKVRHEIPSKKRVRLEYEKCARVYHREMRGKIKFVMRQNDPIPASTVLGLK